VSTGPGPVCTFLQKGDTVGSDYASWAFEVRDLYDRILRAEAEDAPDAATEAMEHLSGLMKQKEDGAVAVDAAAAIWDLTTRYAPEAAGALAARVRRDARLGDSIVRLATNLIESATTEEDRAAAEDLLRRAVTVYPPKRHT
jgi:hypothetical protein